MADPDKKAEDLAAEEAEALMGGVESEGEIVAIPGEEAKAAKPAPKAADAAEEDAPRTRQADESDDAEDADKTETRQHRRRRRGEERRRAAERDKMALAEKDRRIADLEARLGNVETGQRNQGLQNIQAQRNDIAGRIEAAKSLLVNAAKAEDWETHGKVVDNLAEYRLALGQLDNAIAYVKQQSGGDGQRQPPRQDAAPQPDSRDALGPQAQRHKQEFLREHDWIDPSADDRDNRLVRLIDRQVRDAGFDWNSADYWDELRDRMAEHKALAHRFDNAERDDEEDAPRARKPAPKGPTLPTRRDSIQAPKNGQIYLPPQFVQGLKESGAWFDEKRKARAIAGYVASVKDQQQQGVR